MVINMTGYIIYDNAGIKRNSWFAAAMSEYALSKGVVLKTIIREKLQICMKSSLLCLIYDGQILPLPNFVINRCIDPFLAESLELAGVQVFNSSQACRICNDKRLTHIFFSNKGIKMADSIFCDKEYDTKPPNVYPSIIKSAVGHGGNEVFMVKDENEVSLTLKKIASSKYLFQSPVKSLGRDLRVYVMGGKILCSVLRSCDSDFRSNFSLGGKASLYTMTKDQEELVHKITSLLPLTFAGIDFIFNGDEMLLNEVEDIVGSRMIYSLTDIPIHEILVDTVIKLSST